MEHIFKSHVIENANLYKDDNGEIVMVAREHDLATITALFNEMAMYIHKIKCFAEDVVPENCELCPYKSGDCSADTCGLIEFGDMIFGDNSEKD